MRHAVWTCPSDNAAAAPARAHAPLEAVLSGQVLRHGEIVQLVLRPSRWFIVLSSLRSLALIVILTVLAVIFDDAIRDPRHWSVEIGAFLAAARLGWAILVWMGRLYVLTDMRVLALSGVLNTEVFECPLRRVARTLVERPLKERLCRTGSILIIPQDENCPIGVWQTINNPAQVHQRLLAAVARAKGAGNGN